MALPAGFELETAPSRLPAGFELEGPKLPPGFELEGSPVQKMDKTALAKLPQFQQEQPSWLERHADTLYRMIEPYTMHGILSQPARALGYADPDTLASPIPAPDYGPPVGPQGPASKAPSGMTIGPALTVGAGTGGGVGLGGTPIGLPGYTEDMGLLPQPKPDDQTIGQAFPQVFSAIRGLGQGLQQFGHDTINAENLAMLPAFAESKLAQALKYVLGAAMSKNAAEQVASLPERATEAGSNPNASAGDIVRPITETATSLAMPFAIGGQRPQSSAQLGAEAFKSSQPTLGDLEGQQGYTPFPIAKQIPQMVPASSLHPIDLPPREQRFGVEPDGTVLDRSKMTDDEYKAILSRSQQVRPAQTETPIIGQQAQAQVPRLPEGFVLEDPSVALEQANQAAGEPKQGGQISFESEAKADNVPTTNTTAVEPVAEESKLEQPDPNWEVRVQAPVKMDDKTVPGYVQIDDMSGGQNKWSKGPASLKAEGFDIPEGIERLPQGKYSMAEAIAKVKDLPEQPVESKLLQSAQERTAQKGTALYGGMPIGDLEGSFKKIKRYLQGMTDAGHKTIYSEHGLEGQTDTPYVVFSEPSKEQVAKIQGAAEHVGASVDIRPKRTGVYFKGGIQKDVMQDWADFTDKLTREGREGKLYSGIPLMNIEGLKDAVKRMITLNYPATAISGAKDVVPRILDSVFGQGVERSTGEGFSHLLSKQAGESAPHHMSVSSDLGNKMIKYASADATIDAYAKAGAPRPADYKAVAMRDWINQGIKDGVYIYDKKVTPGATPMMGGQPMVALPIRVKGIKTGGRTLYARADLANEAKQVVNNQGLIPKAGAQILLDLATRAQLVGPIDFLSHVRNQVSSVARSMGKYDNLAVDQIARLPIVRRLDAIQKIGFQLHKAIMEDPVTMKRLAELSEIGTGRNDIGQTGTMDKLIRNFDKASRLARDKMYDNLVKMDLTKDTIQGRREFINKIGQYNTKLMSHYMAAAKSIASPFVVAGRQFNRNAVQALTFQNEVKAASPKAYTQMKASNIIGGFASTVAVTMVANSLLTGKPFGRPGTPVGKIDTGKDTKDGRPITIDLTEEDATRRGARITGLEGAIEGVQKGHKAGDIAANAVLDVIKGQLAPWMGPAARMVWEGAKEYSINRNPQDALLKGGEQFNPILASLTKDEQGNTKGLTEYGNRLVSSLGVGKGNFLTHQEKLEQQTGKPLDKMSLEDRLKAERQLKEDQPKLSAEVRTKAAQRQIQKEYRDSQELQDSMSKATKGWLESRELSIPGYKDSIHIAGIDITLIDTEKARYKELVQAEYTKAIDMMKNDKVMNGVGFDHLPKEGQQIAFNRIMIAAKKVAKGKLTKEIESASQSYQK